jgi:hypothetical protein
MIIGKYLVADLVKLMESIKKSRRATTFQVQMDGPKLLVSYEGDDATVTTVTLFDESTRTSPTISRTEFL